MERSMGIPNKERTTVYRYVALTSQNRLVKGNISAANEAVAGRILSERGLRLVNLEQPASMFSLEKMLPSLFGIKPNEAISFSRQLATLLESGIPLLEALGLIEGHTRSRPFRKILGAVVNDLRTGISFSEALEKHPQVFSKVYCKTIALAEQTGNLETMLRQMADYQERQGAAMKKVKSAMTYPVIIFTVAIFVVFTLITFVLPKMIDMFTRMRIELPLPTRILMSVTDFFKDYNLYLLIVAVLLVALVIWLIKQPGGRLWLDRNLLRVPVIGPPLHSAEVARFSETASVLLGTGLAIQEVMEMIPKTCGNRAMSRSLSKVHDELVRGGGIAEPMSVDDLFPPLLTQMVVVGEQSNSLASTLGVAADFYGGHAEDSIDAMVKVVTPAATITIALIVGFIALAVIMPIYSMTGSIE